MVKLIKCWRRYRNEDTWGLIPEGDMREKLAEIYPDVNRVIRNMTQNNATYYTKEAEFKAKEVDSSFR